MTFRLILSVSKDARREVEFLLETGVNHICKINYPGKIPAFAGMTK
jgi:hypothetical protein